MNTKYNADAVIEPAIDGYNIWVRDTIVSTMTQAGYDFIVARIATQQCSIYDVAKGQFISGIIEQIAEEVS